MSSAMHDYIIMVVVPHLLEELLEVYFILFTLRWTTLLTKFTW